MKHQFGEGEQPSDWWDDAIPGTSAGSDSARYLLTLHQCFTWLLSRAQWGTDCRDTLHVMKENQKATKTKVEGIKSYSKWAFLRLLFPIPFIAAAASKACVMLWNAVHWFWAVTGWFSVCKVTLSLFFPLSLCLTVWLSWCPPHPQEISSSALLCSPLPNFQQRKSLMFFISWGQIPPRQKYKMLKYLC